MRTTPLQKGLNPAMFLVRNLFETKNLKQTPTRSGFGEGLVEAGKKDKNIVVLCCDLTESTRADMFKKVFPERFIQMGIAEQALASIGAGLSMAGKVPFISSYAAFSPGRNWEQIKTTIALQNSNVKIAGAHSGLSVGPDGATHQMLEDIILTRAMPNMTVEVPCDAIETRKTAVAGAKFVGPFYFRFARSATPVFTTEKTPFKLGRAEVYRFGNDVTLVAAGPLLYEALLAADALSKEHGIECRVINAHSIKPFDEKTLIAAAKETGAIVTIEEGQTHGGLAGIVCETLALTTPVPVERVGAQNQYGESGEPAQVLEAFGLTAPFIALAVVRVLDRKHGVAVSKIPAHMQAAEERRIMMRKQIFEEALSRAPRKWGGTKPDLQVRSNKKR
ncbi:MAG: transketolase family protein [Candidatus Uhrbacteria bacterium]|nr:transketolase family protein [Candidatus Uhrbacteria bacterium]